MTMASLDASLLARKGTARPIMAKPNIAQALSNRVQFIPHDVAASATQAAKASKIVKEIKGSIEKAITPKSTGVDKRKHKSVRLSAPIDKDLRLLAASKGVSQQSIMQTAISDYLERTYKEQGCICQRKS